MYLPLHIPEPPSGESLHYDVHVGEKTVLKRPENATLSAMYDRTDDMDRGSAKALYFILAISAIILVWGLIIIRIEKVIQKLTEDATEPDKNNQSHPQSVNNDKSQTTTASTAHPPPSTSPCRPATASTRTNSRRIPTSITPPTPPRLASKRTPIYPPSPPQGSLTDSPPPYTPYSAKM